MELDSGLGPVHGLLEPRLLLRLEERMVLERVFGDVAVDRHRSRELGVSRLELEVILNHLCEQRWCLYRHSLSLTGCLPQHSKPSRRRTLAPRRPVNSVLNGDCPATRHVRAMVGRP